MEKLILDEAKKIWTEIAKEKTPGELKLEVELYKKLLNIFQVGDYTYMIFNPPEMIIEFTSPSIKNMLGYEPEDFTLEFLFSIIHPDDLPYFMDFEATVTKFFTQLPPEKIMRYKTRYDYRVRKADGTYIRILQQIVTIQSDEEGAVLRTFVVHTDISHLKTSEKMTLSFIGLEGEPSYHDVKTVGKFVSTREILTRRERQILNMLANNMQTREIAAELNISVGTVTTHRKNMLRKTNTHTILELVSLALQKGWAL